MAHTNRPTIPEAEEILGGYFPVLDHGFVSLVDYMGGDADVERAARVSYGAGTRAVQKTRGLLRYLRRHKHTTPSEMVELKFHCSMPIFVARQWIRHRTASVNELSARYSLMPLLFYTPEPDQVALQSSANRQGREAEGAALEVYQRALDQWEAIREASSDHYGWMLEQDLARELARIDLPLSTYTQWYWKIDLHNLLHFLTLRVDSHAQWEIREYARVMAGMVKRVAPLSFEAWVDYELGGARLSRQEREVLATLVQRTEAGDLASTNTSVTRDEMEASGLSAREIRELGSKLTALDIPDLELDLSRMRSAEDVATEMEAAVPAVDR